MHDNIFFDHRPMTDAEAVAHCMIISDYSPFMPDGGSSYIDSQISPLVYRVQTGTMVMEEIS